MIEEGARRLRALLASAPETTKEMTKETAKEVSQPRSHRRSLPKVLRTQVWGKTYGMETGSIPCFLCKKNVITQSHFTCGHVVSVANGGPDTLENLEAICDSCNLSMGTRDMREFQASLAAARVVSGIPAMTEAKGQAFMDRFRYIPPPSLPPR